MTQVKLTDVKALRISGVPKRGPLRKLPTGPLRVLENNKDEAIWQIPPKDPTYWGLSLQSVGCTSIIQIRGSSSDSYEISLDDGETWIPYTGYDITLRNKYAVAIRVRGMSYDHGPVIMATGRIRAMGSVMSLVDPSGPTYDLYRYQQFYGLFDHCDALIQAPELPATRLSEGCYGNMFSYCHNLTKPPVLPATDLTPYCYAWMFEDCTSLETAPELPSMHPDSYSYACMFQDCVELREPPELPATWLANGCYSGMFWSCYKLRYCPELPATSLYSECYKEMFMTCKSLREYPVNHARYYDEGCVQDMFKDCPLLDPAENPFY